MASLSNGSLPDKNAKKRPLENGHCVQVKYKPRRVSAIRDFPPGCGWDVGPINVNPLENIVAAVAADKVPDVAKADGAITFKIDSEFESDVSQINREPQENAENSVGAYKLLDILEVAVPVQIELEDGAAEIIDGIEVVKPLAVSQPNIAPELLEELNQEESEVLVKELTMGKTQSLKKEELSLSDVAEVQPSAKELCCSGFVSCNKCDVKNINDFDIPVGSSSKSKYPQKRVSAIRDFPPFCGRNAPPPTEEDLARINFGKKNSLKDVTGAGTSRGKVRATDEELGGKFEVVVYSHEKSLTNRKTSNDKLDLEGGDVDRVVVQGLMAAPTKGKKCDFNRSEKEELKNEIVQGLMAAPTKAKKRDFTGQDKSRHGSSMMKASNKNFSSRELKKKLPSPHTDIWDLVVKDREDFSAHNEEETEVSPTGRGSVEFEVTLPPFGPNSSSHGDARNRVRETLRLFHAICRKVLQGEEAKSRNGEQRKSRKDIKRIDLFAAKTVKDKGKEVNTEKQILGAVPGVEVGDEFQFRVELAIIGIHRLYQAGIDFIKHKGENVAASVVASGSYADELNNPDVVIYSGQGGLSGKDKQPEDQKLERGNLALKNSISAKNPVRVIRGSKESKTSESANAKGRPSMTYVYDGLYKVDRYWQEVGARGKLMFKFELRRIHGQPELAWKEVKQSNKTKTRDGLCIDDISGGEEETRICVVNTIDDERPPPFKYVTKMIYPNYCLRSPLKGCDCKGRCSDSGKCMCAEKNGGIPYNHNRAIVEMKPLVYECGPRCKCPPSCYNRVSQHGIKFQLEIFKTESRGWGVRSLNSIPSGSFICEYTGELLEDGEAEKRTGNDEYLFDIGQNYNDCAIDGGGPQASCSNIGDDGGFVIDAAKFGNVGRFINHSCSPNLYAQNVLYDHVDKRMPHIMLFAAENIPPLQELTYHYNYSVDQIHDSNGNIKMKVCYCGSAECTGRMY